MKRFAFAASAIMLVALAGDVSAQGFINPFVGTTLTAPTATGAKSQPGFGVAFGSLGKIVGFETEVAYYPEVLDNTANALGKSKVFTFSGNTLIGPTIGPVRPYGAVGFGDLFLNVSSASSVLIPNPASISSNYFTINYGGGAMGFFTAHLGVRGDLRYYRAFGFNAADIQTTGLRIDNFNFWRANIGLAIKF